MTLALTATNCSLPNPDLSRPGAGGARGLLVRIHDGWGDSPCPASSERPWPRPRPTPSTAWRSWPGPGHDARLPSVQFGLDCARRAWPVQTAPAQSPIRSSRALPGAAQELEAVAALRPRLRPS